MTQAFEKCQLDGQLLGRREDRNYSTDEDTRIADSDFLLCSVMDPGVRLLLGLLLKSFFGASISLFFTQSVDRASPSQRYHPAKWLTFLSGEIFGLIPNLHENLLQQVVCLSLVVDNAKNQGFDDPVVAIV